MNHHDEHTEHVHHTVLDLDAEVFGDQLNAALDLLPATTPARIVDLGAGTGTGTRLLRDRFPGTTVTAVDNSPEMLERLRQQGFETVEADLDAGMPEVGAVDLVWAASSLHHVGDPARLLAGVRRALSPQGRCVVVELDGLPRFLGTDLEQRCHTAAAAAGWNHYPDWTPVIEQAGFAVVRSSLSLRPPVTPAARRYAGEWLPRFLDLPGLAAADRDALAALLAEPSKLDLRLSSSRTVWVAEPIG